jgi:molecular chaperone GrpE (heat shock protein)
MELMTLHRLEQRLENERQRYVRQQEREELLSRRMQRTRQNIENLEYALQSLERIISLHRR